MANQTGYISVIRDALTGNRVGFNTYSDVLPGSARDILTGDRYGKNLVAEAWHADREILTGDRYGLNVYGEALPGTAREILTGDGFGMTWLAGGAQIVREVIIMEPPYKMARAVREVLVSIPNDPVTVGRYLTGYRQSVVMLRPKMALPSMVKSPQIVPTLRMQTVQRAIRPWTVSDKFASTLHMQSVLRRFFSRAPQVWSTITTGSYVQQVVRSRGQVYVAVSEVRVKGQVQQVAQRRPFTPASQIRTPISVGGLVEQWIASRARKIVVITTEAHVFTLAEQVVQASGKPAPHSPEDAASLVEMVVQRRVVVPPNSGENAMQLAQQIVRMREVVAPRSADFTGTLAQQTVIPRSVDAVRSTTTVAESVMLAVVDRFTYSPGNIIGRHAKTLQSHVVQQRTDSSVKRRSPVIVGELSLRYVLGRTTPKPWDVIDPSIGRHVGQLIGMVVMHRATTPPEIISKQSRYVFSVTEQVVARDTFPAPDMPPPVVPETYVGQVLEEVVVRDTDWGPMSSITSIQVVADAVVGDNHGWIDPRAPTSEIRTYEVFGTAVVGDTFPTGDQAQSDARVAAITESVALGDSSFPNALVPQSVVQVRGVSESAAVGDAQFPNPMIPASEVRSSLVGAAVAVRDPSLQGNFGGSEIAVPSVVEFALIVDPSLVGIPRRTGPRPIVTVSMS